MKRNFIILFCLPLVFANCKDYSVKLETSPDPDIVLVNLEEADRAAIGKILLKLDSLSPVVVGIEVTFKGRKNKDSTLIAAFEKLENDILVYNIKQGSINGSDSVFTNLTDEGNLYYEQRMGLVTTIVPVQKVNGVIHESFALKIIKKWKPGFTSQIKVDERIDIHYARDLKRFQMINGSNLLSTKVENIDWHGKVFLVGYMGPGNDDKHFTPLRHFEGEYKTNEPDTYGLVIIANEIRTILEHKKQ